MCNFYLIIGGFSFFFKGDLFVINYGSLIVSRYFDFLCFVGFVEGYKNLFLVVVYSGFI